jgi:hypothetical protein
LFIVITYQCEFADLAIVFIDNASKHIVALALGAEEESMDLFGSAT